jgi:hypothetical protein
MDQVFVIAIIESMFSFHLNQPSCPAYHLQYTAGTCAPTASYFSLQSRAALDHVT